jgi:DNA modification methylase
MAKKGSMAKSLAKPATPAPGRPSALLDTRVVYCGDNLEQLAKPALSPSNGLPDTCVDLIYVDPAPASEAELTSVSAVELPFNSNRSYEVFWGETKEKRPFEDRQASTQAYPGAPGRPRCVQLARVLKKTGSFYYHCDWHASHYARMADIVMAKSFQTRAK